MKKIKLMALGLMVMMIQSVGAVTLPSTSYSPYASGSTYGGSESGVVFSSGSMVSGSYSALMSDETDEYFEDCVDEGDPGSNERIACCEDARADCYADCPKGDTECYSACASSFKSCVDAGSLPLDGGLSILLVLALGSGAVRMFRKK